MAPRNWVGGGVKATRLTIDVLGERSEPSMEARRGGRGCALRRVTAAKDAEQKSGGMSGRGEARGGGGKKGGEKGRFAKRAKRDEGDTPKPTTAAAARRALVAELITLR